MQITRNRTDSSIGPADWFTGTVLIDTITTQTAPSRVAAANVHFMPGARTHWHSHPVGQTIWVTEGVGLCQRRGGPVEVIWPGDRVVFAPGEDHWHGACSTRFMVHVAIHEADDSGSTVSWGAAVSDVEYGSAPRLEDSSPRSS
ncbi:cupin domain-containing protein [Conexibacter sp. DBS9H8]|uniref:(R)-mandelonitrile lyase n=1 Tax=Conexibacter sp. DBS9H8 TaxID=2937801 RepID=UPI00200FB539|nr:cupin domain-containing protein [Conexibacter sp. DBS9H8]